MNVFIGQSVFKLIVNRDFQNGAIFSVKEMRVIRTFEGDLTRCELLGKNKEFEAVYSSIVFDKMPNRYEVVLGSTFYLTSFEKLDEAIELAKQGLLACYATYFKSLEKEINLLECSPEDYLLEHSIDIPLLTVDLNSLVNDNHRNVHIELSHSFIEDTGLHFNLDAITLRKISKEEIQEILEEHPDFFDFDYYNEQIPLEDKRLFESSKYIFNLQVLNPYSSDWFAPDQDLFSVAKFAHYDTDFFITKHIPYNEFVNADTMLRQVAAFRVKTEPFLKKAYLFHKELHTLLTTKSMFEIINQEFYD